MNQIEAYTLLFTDVLVSNFAFNISGEIVFTTMKIFGQYDSKLLIIVSLAAYMISVVINYIFGIICYKILAPVNKNDLSLVTNINNIRNFRLLPLVLVLSFIPFFGKFIILFSGFCRIKFKLLFITALVAKFSYYVILNYAL